MPVCLSPHSPTVPLSPALPRPTSPLFWTSACCWRPFLFAFWERKTASYPGSRRIQRFLLLTSAGDNKENVSFPRGSAGPAGPLLSSPCFSLFRSAGEGAEIEYHFTESEKTPMDFVNFVVALSPILVVLVGILGFKQSAKRVSPIACLDADPGLHLLQRHRRQLCRQRQDPRSPSLEGHQRGSQDRAHGLRRVHHSEPAARDRRH